MNLKPVSIPNPERRFTGTVDGTEYTGRLTERQDMRAGMLVLLALDGAGANWRGPIRVTDNNAVWATLEDGSEVTTGYTNWGRAPVLVLEEPANPRESERRYREHDERRLARERGDSGRWVREP